MKVGEDSDNHLCLVGERNGMEEKSREIIGWIWDRLVVFGKLSFCNQKKKNTTKILLH